MQHPSLYLVGGPPGAGKTTLGISIASRLGCPFLTIDDLRTSLLALTDASRHPDLHVIGLPDPWTYFTETDPTTMIDHAVSQHTALWPGIARVVRKRLGSKQSAVVEGWHLMPALVAGIADEGMCSVWLDVDHGVLEARERSVWDFYARSPDPELMFSNFLARSTRWNDLVADQAGQFGYPRIAQDGSVSVDALTDQVLSLGRTERVRPSSPLSVAAQGADVGAEPACER